VGKTMAMKDWREDFEEEIPKKKNDILCPDLQNYILKEDVKRNYVPLEEVKANYVLKKNCAADIKEEKLYLSLDDVKKNYVLKKDCGKQEKKKDDVSQSSSSSEEEKPVEKPNKKIAERDRKIQNYFDKNKDNMDVSYSLLKDAYCNKKTCLPNGLPDGLKPE
jgi:hypothetical protein